MKHLLFIPAPEHRDALLGEGVGGSRPPVAWFHPASWERHALDSQAHGYGCVVCGEDWPCGQPDREEQPARWSQAAGWEWEREGVGCSTYPHDGALILVWNGLIAVEGCDRLVRVRRSMGRFPHRIEEWMSYTTKMGRVALLADAAVAAGLGTMNEVIEEAP